MDTPYPELYFWVMIWLFKMRDLLWPRRHVLAEVYIQPGFCVLDYGCGPGSYTVIAARLVGESGKVYALDIHPLAIQMVQRKANKRNLTNIETITSDCATGLPSNSIDIALLYDILHMLSEPARVLKELHRVLKPGGTLSVSDHHLNADKILGGVTREGWFQSSEKGRQTIGFLKAG